MKVRLEFWNLSNPGGPARTVLLNRTFTGAVELTTTTEDYDLPEDPMRAGYALKVIAIEEAVVVEVAPVDELNNDPDYAAYIAEGDYAWFEVLPESALYVAAYE